jgi:hypothetical protein
MSEEIKEMDKEFNQIAIKQELASSIDEKAETASIESNKNMMYEANYDSSEMLSLIKECLSEIESSCYERCSEYSTPECRICDTGKLQKRIKSTIKKAKGK